MDIRIIALLVVVCGFALLTAWVFWPSNKARLEAHGRLILDASDEGDQER